VIKDSADDKTKKLTFSNLESSIATPPGGSDTQVQFNDGGSLGGDAGMTYNKTTDSLSTEVYSFVSDSDTSISATGDVLTETVGGVVSKTVTESGSAITTAFTGTLKTGPGTTYTSIDEAGDGIIEFYHSGNRKAFVYGQATGQLELGGISSVVITSTDGVKSDYYRIKNDEDTHISSGGADVLTETVGGVVARTATESGSAITHALTGDVSATKFATSATNYLEGSGVTVASYIRTSNDKTLFLLTSGTDFQDSGTAIAAATGTMSQGDGEHLDVFKIGPTYNQTGTASATDLKILRTETAVGSGDQKLIEAGTTVDEDMFVVDNTGSVIATGGVVANSYSSGSGIFSHITTGTVVVRPLAISAAGDNAIELGDGSNGVISSTSGNNSYVRINALYNQTSGTAANTDLKILRTETAIGSGAQKLIEAGTSADEDMFVVDNEGGVSNVGSISRNITTPDLSGNTYTVLSTDYTVLIDDDDADVTGTVVVTLPAAASSTGRILNIKKIGSSQTVQLDGNGAETIDGAADADLSAQWESITIQCNGTSWFVI